MSAGESRAGAQFRSEIDRALAIVREAESWPTPAPGPVPPSPTVPRHARPSRRSADGLGYLMVGLGLLVVLVLAVLIAVVAIGVADPASASADGSIEHSTAPLGWLVIAFGVVVVLVQAACWYLQELRRPGGHR